MRLISILCTALCLLSSARGAAANATLILFYDERPPFFVTLPDGEVTGLSASPTAKAFAAAGIMVRWQKIDRNRILPMLARNDLMGCSGGWYYTAERAANFRFTRPIYHDKPFVGVVRANDPAPQSSAARELLNRPGIRVTERVNLAHGDYIDRLIGHMPGGQVTHLSVDAAAILKMIYASRTDLTFVTEEEVEQLFREADLSPDDFHILHFVDDPAADYRYIVCSKQVPQEIIRRLDEVIPPIKY